MCGGGKALQLEPLLMSHAGAAPAVVEDALRMISLVSCSSNGNAAPPEARTPAELFWPRQTSSFLVHSLLMLSVESTGAHVARAALAEVGRSTGGERSAGRDGREIWP